MSAGLEVKMTVAKAVLTHWASQKHWRPLLVELKAKWYAEEEVNLCFQKEVGVSIDHLVKNWRKDAM